LGKAMPMVPKLAYRNLFHDRLSLIVTLVGIVFSVVLVAVQFGIYLGSENRIAAMLDQAKGDLWVVALGTKSFDDPSLLSGRERHAVLSTPGVASVEELAVGFVNWRKPKGGSTAALLVGSEISRGSSLPWNVTQGSASALGAPSAVAIDSTYFSELGINKLGDRAEVNNMEVTVNAVTQGIRSFTTLPYVFTTLATARTLLNASPDQSSYTLVNVAPGTSIETVRAALSSRLPDAEILTHAEFRKRSLDYWLFETGAGAALIAGAALGIIVGIVIVAQTPLRQHQGPPERVRHAARSRSLGRLHQQGDPDAGRAQRADRLPARHGAEHGGDLGLAGLHPADRHDAWPSPACCSPDRRHVRARRPVRHLQGCPHRSGCRVQPLTFNGRLRP
jgi:putative ABC transport system permease protein